MELQWLRGTGNVGPQVGRKKQSFEIEDFGKDCALNATSADGHLADGEAMVVEAARRHWQLFDGAEPLASVRARRQES